MGRSQGLSVRSKCELRGGWGPEAGGGPEWLDPPHPHPAPCWGCRQISGTSHRELSEAGGRSLGFLPSAEGSQWIEFIGF